MPDISYKQIIDRALRVATMTGGDPNASPVIDNVVVLEDLAPMALRKAIIEGASDPDEANELKIAHTITISLGVGDMPDEVINELLDRSSVSSTTDDDITQFTSFQPRLMDYLRPVHSQLGYYTAQGQNILFREPGGNAGAFDGTIVLNAVSMPVEVVDLTSFLHIPTDTAERAIQILPMMLRGAPPAKADSE